MNRKTIAKVYLTFWIFVIGALLLATVYQGVSLNRDLARIAQSIRIKIPSILLIGGPAQIAMIVIVRKLKILMKQIDQTGRAEKELILKVHKRIKQLGRVFLVVNSLGFFLGPSISFVIFAITGKGYPPFEIFFIITTHLMIGTVCSLLQLSMIQIIFRDLLDSFRMFQLIPEMKGMPVFRKRLLSSLFMLILFAFLMGGHLYGILVQIAGGGLDPRTEAASLIMGLLFHTMVDILLLMLFQYVLAKEEQGKLKQLQDSMEMNLEAGSQEFRQIRIIAHDDYGRLASSVNSYTKRLSDLIENIALAGQTVSATSGQLTDAIRQSEESLETLQKTNQVMLTEIRNEQNTMDFALQAMDKLDESIRSVGDAVNEQASFVEESSASISQMSANIRSVGEISTKASAETDHLNEMIGSGSERLKDTISSISVLKESSDKVQSIIKVIQGISAQTNLLAMNAAIEAAHAGSAGAGFSVVADEVRKLAEESSRSAQDIKDIISGMAEAISAGVGATQKTEQAFEAITNAVANTSRIINTVKASMDEQQAAATEITSAMISLVDVSNTLKDEAEHQTSNNESMNTSFQNLKQSVIKLKDISEIQQSEDRSLGKVILGLRQISTRNGDSVSRLEKAAEFGT